MRVTGATCWVPGGPDGLLHDLIQARPRTADRPLRAPEPTCPRVVSAGAWRRMSRLSRLVLATATPLLEGRDDLDQIAVVWGNCMGELVPITRFLERLFDEGPAHVSPLNFQNSVTNAPAGHLSLALALHGLSETVSAGGASSLAALLRGIDLVRLGRAPAALVIAGDDLNPTAEEAWSRCASGLRDAPPILGEAMAALLLEPGRGGAGVEVTVGLEGPGLGGDPHSPVFARQACLPGEAPLAVIDGAIAPERCIGLVPSGGLAVLAALAAAGRPGTLIEQDGPMILRARFTPGNPA